MDDAVYWLALRDSPGMRADWARDLVLRFGAPRAVFGQPAERLRAWVPASVAARLARPPELAGARAELERARRSGCRALLQGAPGFPPALEAMADPPLVLYLRGTLPSGPAVAIVGSRRASASGRGIARAFARRLAAAGVTVVSGLAYGIDGAAHAGALEGGGATVAVLASGPDRPGPAGHRSLARAILEQGGGWLSEYPPGTPARPYHFPARNRVISALARATLVVEARERSGSLWTARHALEQGRGLLVVPGPIDSDHCTGSNRLLRDGVPPALDAEDVLAAVFPDGDAPPAAPVPTDAEDRALLAALREGPVDVDALVRRLGCSASQLAARLLSLELRSLVAREGSRVALGSAAPPRGRDD